MCFNNNYNFLSIHALAAPKAFTGQKLLNRFRPSRLIDQPMKTKTFSLIAAASLVLSGMAFGVQDYQVTGPVAEVNDSMIVVEKGAKKERFEVARDSSTKMSGDVKVGDKVTVHYTMTAKDVEVKAAKGEKGTKKEMKAAASPAASPKN
jgi:ribosomal 50S subunit-recycling heat shock protein